MTRLSSSPSASSISSWELAGEAQQQSDLDSASWEMLSSRSVAAFDADMELSETCQRVLGELQLDDDTISFLARGILDEGSLLPPCDFREFVQPILTHACAGNEERAAALTDTLQNSLVQLFATTTSCHEPKEVPREQHLATLEQFAPTCKPDASTQPHIARHQRQDCTSQGGANQEKRHRSSCGRASIRKQQKMHRMAQKMQLESESLEGQILAAREKAMMLKGIKGYNFKQAIKIGPFDLPHPGGLGNLLEGVSMTLTPGHRYALVGRNGKGKSTLLQNLAARRIGGLHPGVRVHYVSQDVSLSSGSMSLTPVEVLLDADVERRSLLSKLKTLESSSVGDEHAELHECLEQLKGIDAQGAPSRARRLLANLGFSDGHLEQKMHTLSGGWRVRVALAAAIFAEPDLLFLDEPTNHLSMQAVLWLVHELTASPTWSSRTVVVVSHDRFFIDETCTDMLHISGRARRLTQTSCSYTTWARFRAEQKQSYEHRREVRKADIARCQAYVASGAAACGQTASSSRRLRIEKLEKEAEAEEEELLALQEDHDFPLRIHAGGDLNETAVRLEDVSFAYPGREPLLSEAGRQPYEFNVDSRSRIVLVGENGAGKTTLLRLLLGRLQPTRGEVVINRHVRFAVLDQHHADQIDLARSPFEFVKDKVPGDGSESWQHYLRQELVANGIGEKLLDLPAAALSGGLRSRLVMVAASVSKPHVLLMDEPTNNLDISGVEALAEAVRNFEGGVVVISHDQHFVSQVAQEVWSVNGGRLSKFECGFEEYLATLLCRIDPGSSAAAEAVSAYARKKRMTPAYISGGQASREALARELSRLRSLIASCQS
eukprot:TRINITY_DN11168_c0_g1_i1.p1 TRINITY_DN11168_c0_g1~~TRINITY_DN11168_c0_g1_i1.p1  ORF type:complete len:834 (-),score=137.17 TRINITY_DN11168_c0_g1_i1:56-2557(-)